MIAINLELCCEVNKVEKASNAIMSYAVAKTG